MLSVASLLIVAWSIACAQPVLAAAQPWWQTAVVYQIYPRSFQDSNGDGIGDLRGITARVPYLKDLGVTAVWISPVYQSPMKDFGYDVSDYEAVDARFGSMADLDELIKTLHGQGLKVVMDLVVNHTSIEHAWFKDAKASKQSAKRDWYVWRDPGPDGGPPNNWRGVFAGDAWTLDKATGQYYYHAFLPEQPDLNWRNPQVRQAMLEVMRFWLDKGVDGFRVDAIGQLVEDAQFRNEPRNPAATAASTDYDHFIHEYTTELPETHTFLRDMRRVVDSYPGDRVLISEAYLPIPKLMAYYGSPQAKESQLPFNFHLIAAPWAAKPIGDYATAYDAALPKDAWPNWVLGNHDRSRLATRIGEAQSRLAAMLLLTLRGTPTLYYGDELGLTDVPVASALAQDPAEMREPGKGMGRDPERTPMPWDETPHGGFTTGQPWLPIGNKNLRLNVVTATKTSGSLLRLYQKLLALRGQHPALAIGDYATVSAQDDVLVFTRTHSKERLTVALNFSDQPRTLHNWPKKLKPLLSTLPDLKGHRDQTVLRPNEGVVFQSVAH